MSKNNRTEPIERPTRFWSSLHGSVLTFVAATSCWLLEMASPLTVYGQESEEEIVELEEYEVAGFREGLAKAMADQRAASNIIDIVSADSVGKLPDSNVAEALSRMPSVHIVQNKGEGRYLSIRGVDPALNNVTLNGQSIAVSDNDGRGGRQAPLDVLSAASVDQIEVIKTVTPDMDANSVGGIINLKMPSAFDHEGTFAYGSGEVGFNDLCDDCEIYSATANFGTRIGEKVGVL